MRSALIAVELDGKAGKPRIGRTHKAPQDAKGDETSNRRRLPRRENSAELRGPEKARD